MAGNALTDAAPAYTVNNQSDIATNVFFSTAVTATRASIVNSTYIIVGCKTNKQEETTTLQISEQTESYYYTEAVHLACSR